MSNCNETALPPATLAAIIDHARETGATTRKAVAIAADASEEMVRRWEEGQLPKLRPFKRLIARANLLPDSLKTMMLDWFLRGTGWRAVPVDEADRTVLDHNGDGIVDAKDTGAFVTHGICVAGQVLETLLDYDGGNDAERASLLSQLYMHREQVDRAIDSLKFDNPNRMRVAR